MLIRKGRWGNKCSLFDMKSEVDLDLYPWALDPWASPSDFFLKLANPTAFSPQVLSNTITPCVPLEYLREIRSHSIKNLV